MPGTTTIATDDTTFADVVIASPTTVLVDFWAPWCGPCKRLGPVLDQLGAAHPDLTIVTVNVDESPVTQQRYQVMSLPTLMVFADGQPTTTVLGAKNLKALEKALAGAI